MDHLKYQLVTPSQYEEAIHLFNSEFLSHEPITRAIGCTEQTNTMDQYILSTLKENLSWCVVDQRTGRMVGVRITGSQTLDESQDVPTFDRYVEQGYSRKWASFLLLIGAVLDTKKVLTAYHETKILKLIALCVHHDYRKKGIATELVRCTLDHAVKLGYTFAGVVCTSIYTQALFVKLGFEKVEERYYADYVDLGTNSLLFKDVEEPHKSIISYVKKLNCTDVVSE